MDRPSHSRHKSDDLFTRLVGIFVISAILDVALVPPAVILQSALVAAVGGRDPLWVVVTGWVFFLPFAWLIGAGLLRYSILAKAVVLALALSLFTIRDRVLAIALGVLTGLGSVAYYLLSGAASNFGSLGSSTHAGSALWAWTIWTVGLSAAFALSTLTACSLLRKWGFVRTAAGG